MLFAGNIKKRDNAILVFLFVLFLFASIDRNKNSLDALIISDIEGYYMYLPAVFVYHDFHHLPIKSTNNRVNEQGETVIKYTCGVAFFYTPFFLAAHAWAHLAHYDTSGFSTPYYYAMILCGLSWSFLGLYFLKRLLSKYFTRRTMWLALLCIMLGTNFYIYATVFMGMSHIYSFALVSAILFFTDWYYTQPSGKLAVLLGLLIGWLILVRPTNCVLVIFLLLYRVVSFDDLKQRLAFLRSRSRDLLAAIPFMLLMFLPQMLYWHEMTGHWVHYSYSGETFRYWNRPKLAGVLVDTQNGLFLYSPVLLFMLPGLFWGRKDPRTSFAGVCVLFPLVTYLFASWCIWWFGGAFGHRCYIEYFPVLALSIAVAMDRIFSSKRLYLKIPVFIVVVLFCYYNIGMSHLFLREGVWDGDDWRWNWEGWWRLVGHAFKVPLSELFS